MNVIINGGSVDITGVQEDKVFVTDGIVHIHGNPTVEILDGKVYIDSWRGIGDTTPQPKITFTGDSSHRGVVFTRTKYNNFKCCRPGQNVIDSPELIIFPSGQYYKYYTLPEA